MRNRTRFFYLLIFIILFASIFYIYKSNQNDLYFYKSDTILTPTLNSVEPKQEVTKKVITDRNNVITNAVKEVSPAVVGINVIEIRKYQNPYNQFYNDPFFRQFFGNNGEYRQKVKELGCLLWLC